jgi:hypothetical protein
MLLWDQQLQTDRTMPPNEPDTITYYNDNETCMLIYVAISGERKVIKKEAEKILKHRDLTKETQLMWSVKRN